jgi:Bax protein
MIRLIYVLHVFLMLTVHLSLSAPAVAQEVVVLVGIDEVIEWLENEDWWGEEMHGEQLAVPHMILTGINPAWREAAQELSVADKKEVFYRFMLPLVVHANELVRERRASLLGYRRTVLAGETLSDEDLSIVRRAAALLRVMTRDAAVALETGDSRLLEVIDELVYRLDVIPAGLALGQAAYESGYGTSRFTIEGNALFGQWTYGGKGLVPEQQRHALGDHRIAAYDWPFDSVRGYFLNLMSHPAYEDFRRARAELRAAGQPLSSLVLADELINYSEQGQAYVDTLKSIIRVNELDVADGAVFRDEPMRLVVGAADASEADELRAEITRIRGTGEFARIIERMRLE